MIKRSFVVVYLIGQAMPSCFLGSEWTAVPLRRAEPLGTLFFIISCATRLTYSGERHIERAVIVTQGNELQFGDWLDPPDESLQARPKPDRLEDVERAHILTVLEETGWRVSGEKGAAHRLGLPPSTLESRMKRLGNARAP